MKFIDRDNVHGLINQFPALVLDGYGTKLDFKPYKLPKNANYVVCGMGGSNFVVDLIRDFFDLGLHIYTSRTYFLPKQTNERSLVVIVSFSGTTEESLACYKEARRKKLPIIAMASRGTLESWARRDKVPFVRISTVGLTQPRYSYGYQLGYHLRILEIHKLISSQKKYVEAGCKESAKFNFEKDGAGLAKKIVGRMPLIYVDGAYESLGRASIIKISESAKMLAHYNVLPEMNHNEINGAVFSKRQGKFSAVFLLSKSYHPRILKRFKVLGSLMKRYGIHVYEFWLPGKTSFAQMVAGIEISDWIAFYLAQENKIDPSPVAIIETFKKLIG